MKGETRELRSGVERLWLGIFAIVLIFSIIVISYGVDAIVPGIHDAFHDFRHVIGIPCH